MGRNKNTGRKQNSSPAQLANLRSTDKMTPEERREFSRKGAKASHERRAQAKTFKQAAVWLAALPVARLRNKSDMVKELLEEFPDMNMAEAMTAAVMVNAIVNGDPKAFSTIRDTTGELPAQSVNINTTEPMTINIKTI